jgi:hypothetical protein
MADPMRRRNHSWSGAAFRKAKPDTVSAGAEADSLAAIMGHGYLVRARRQSRNGRLPQRVKIPGRPQPPVTMGQQIAPRKLALVNGLRRRGPIL